MSDCAVIESGARLPKIPADVSVFVSSTFRDMQDERDALRDLVLPGLRETVSEYGVGADFVDLRWGVDTSDVSESEQDAKVLKTCFEEIDRCEPFFLLLLGDRYGYVPGDGGPSVTEREVEYALSHAKAGRLLFCFRSIENKGSLTPAQRKAFLDPSGEQALQALKTHLRSTYPDSVLDYRVRILEDGSYDLAEFCAGALSALRELVHKELGEPPARRFSPLDVERAYHRRYAHELSSSFVGRKEIVANLTEFCMRREPRLLLIQGEPGVGKTALLARVACQLETSCLTVPVFCGMGLETTDDLGVLRYLVRSLDAGVDLNALYRMDYPSLCEAFSIALRNRAAEGQVAVIVDGLDQLLCAGHEPLGWVPDPLPEGCRILCTSIPVERGVDAGRVDWRSRSLEGMSERDARQVVAAICTASHKPELPEPVVALLMAKALRSELASPLYLSLVVRYLLTLSKRDYDEIEKERSLMGSSPMQAQISVMTSLLAELPVDCEGMYEELVRRISGAMGLSGYPQFLFALAASRHGLRVEDLAGAIGNSFDPAAFARFRQMLPGNFIQRTRMEWDFAHQSFRRMLWARHRDEVLSMNRDVMAPYLFRRAWFVGEPLPGCEAPVYAASSRDAFIDEEVMHHLYLADDAGSAADLLCRKDLVERPSERRKVDVFHDEISWWPVARCVLEGFADIYSLEAKKPFEDTFAYKTICAMHGRPPEDWYMLCLMVDRTGLYWFPQTHGVNPGRALQLYEAMLAEVESSLPQSDTGLAVRAMLYCEAANILNMNPEALGRDVPDRQQKTIAYAERALRLWQGYDQHAVTKRFGGLGFNIFPRASHTLSSMYPEVGRYEDAFRCAKDYLTYTLNDESRDQTSLGYRLDLIPGYSAACDALFQARRGREAVGYRDELVRILLDIDEAELTDAFSVSNVQAGWLVSSTISETIGEVAEARAYGYKSFQLLMKTHRLWPNYLGSPELMLRALSSIRAFGAIVELDKESREQLERSYLSYADYMGEAIRNARFSLGGQTLTERFIELGLSDDVVGMAYRSECFMPSAHRHVIGEDIDRLEKRDRLDLLYASYEEFRGRYEVSDEIFGSLERSLEYRIDSPMGSIVNYRLPWEERLKMVREVKPARVRAIEVGVFDDETPVEDRTDARLAEIAAANKDLRRVYANLTGRYDYLEERETGLLKRYLRVSRELKKRPSQYFDAREHAHACLRIGSLDQRRVCEVEAYKALLGGTEALLVSRELAEDIKLLAEGEEAARMMEEGDERNRLRAQCYGGMAEMRSALPLDGNPEKKEFVLDALWHAMTEIRLIKKKTDEDRKFCHYVESRYRQLKGHSDAKVQAIDGSCNQG